MARKRMIDPNIWQSEDFAKLSQLAKLIFIGLFANADDSGRGRAKAAYIKSILFPYDEQMRIIDVDKTLSEIGSNMSVTFYLHDGNEYYCLDNWHKWQKIDRPSESHIPPPGEESETIRCKDAEHSSNIRRTLAERSTLKEKNIKEENIKEKKGKEDAPTHEKQKKHKRGEYGWVVLADEELERLRKDHGATLAEYYVKFIDESAQQTGNKNKWKDWNLTIRKAIRGGWGNPPADSQALAKRFVKTGIDDAGNATGHWEDS